jgi:ADP-ribosylglycohydrolase
MRERIIGCLKGIATGDAVGKQTEGLARASISRWYPDGVRGFEGKPGSVIPRYLGNAKREWRIGETTDDTERTIAVARAILYGDGPAVAGSSVPSVHHATVGRELLKCEKCVHPGVRSLWEFHQAGDPARVAREHDGCGAAVRVAPVGILYRSDRVDAIVAGAREASVSTHGGALAIAAAAATAAAVSAAIDGLPAFQIIDAAIRAASASERQWSASPARSVAACVRQVYDDLRHTPELHSLHLSPRYFPDNVLIIVPLALALAAVMDSAEAAILLAANIGGDSDSVASIAGGILGARHPHTISEEWYSVVEQVNGHDLVALGERLGALRS